MSDRDSLGDRMKGYESVPRVRLVPKMPVLLRLDGKAFHTLTRGMDKPVDENFVQCMRDTAVYLCREIQGAQVGYLQSDEISILLIDYQTIQTQGWFDYEIQKMCSVAAAMASVVFNSSFQRLFPQRCEWPVFDCRAWNLPREEVVNAFIWRQQDATRNSVQSLAHANFSHKELHHKDQREMQDMLMSKGINWNDCPTVQKRGACVVKETYEIDAHEPGDHWRPTGTATRTRWVVDAEIPIFTQDRNYIQRFVDTEVQS